MPAILLWVCLLVLGAHGPLALSAGLDSDAVVARLQKHYNGIKTIDADFEQETVLTSLNQRRVAKGRVYLKKPGHMRWTYTSPNKQEIISDGKTLWIYAPAEKRVYMFAAKTYLESQLTMNFFLGQGDFKRDFLTSVEPETDSSDCYILKLSPREPHPHISEMKLWIHKSNFLIKKVCTRDHVGNITFLSLSNQKVNGTLGKDIFAFVPPPGTETIRGKL